MSVTVFWRSVLAVMSWSMNWPQYV